MGGQTLHFGVLASQLEKDLKVVKRYRRPCLTPTIIAYSIEVLAKSN